MHKARTIRRYYTNTYHLRRLQKPLRWTWILSPLVRRWKFLFRIDQVFERIRCQASPHLFGVSDIIPVNACYTLYAACKLRVLGFGLIVGFRWLWRRRRCLGGVSGGKT